MGLAIDLWSAEGQYARLSDVSRNLIRAAFESTIDQSATFNFESPVDVAELDQIVVTEDGRDIGTFLVTRTEPAWEPDGTHVCRATAEHEAPYVLRGTGIPGESFLEEQTIVSGINLLGALVKVENTGPVQFSYVNADLAAIATPNYKDATADNALDAFSNLLKEADQHWRSRPDLGKGDIQIGSFGTRNDFLIRPGFNRSVKLPLDIRRIEWTDAKLMVDTDDYVNAIFPEGGSWSDWLGSDWITYILLISDVQPPSSEYIKEYRAYPNGVSYFSLSRPLDENGRPYARRRSRRAKFAGIVPRNDTGDPPTYAMILEAQQQLMTTAVALLKKMSVYKTTADVSIPASLAGHMHVGDVVHCEIPGAPVTHWYIATMNVSWGTSGEVETRLELSNRLESLKEPTAQNFNASDARLRTQQTELFTGSYTAIGLTGTGGIATLAFPVTYPYTPAFTVTVPIGYAYTVQQATNAYIVVAISPADAGVVVQCVTTPYR